MASQTVSRIISGFATFPLYSAAVVEPRQCIRDAQVQPGQATEWMLEVAQLVDAVLEKQPLPEKIFRQLCQGPEATPYDRCGFIEGTIGFSNNLGFSPLGPKSTIVGKLK